MSVYVNHTDLPNSESDDNNEDDDCQRMLMMRMRLRMRKIRVNMTQLFGWILMIITMRSLQR